MNPTQDAVKCTTCGMRADADPEFHAERYGHWPTVKCAGCRSSISYGGPDICERCDLHEHWTTCRGCGASIRELYAVNKCLNCGHSQRSIEWDRTVAPR